MEKMHKWRWNARNIKTSQFPLTSKQIKWHYKWGRGG